MVVLSKRPPAPVTGSTVSRLGKALAVGGLVLVLSVALLGWLALIDSGPLDLEQISFAPEAFVELIRGWGAWGVAGSLALMVLHSFVPFPAECLALANGMVFGLFWGSLITWSGAMLGAWLAFGLARTLGRPFVGRVLPARHRERIDAWSGDHGWSALLAARLVPVIAFNLINYAAGLVRVSVLMVLLGERMATMPAWAWFGLVLFAFVLWRLLHRFQRAATPETESVSEADA
jgi:uncharacterized membrane protein YdjX (TVP38/TMEM64 family)